MFPGRDMRPQEVPCMCSAYAYGRISAGVDEKLSAAWTKEARILRRRGMSDRQKGWLTDHMRWLAAHHRGEG